MNYRSLFWGSGRLEFGCLKLLIVLITIIIATLPQNLGVTDEIWWNSVCFDIFLANFEVLYVDNELAFKQVLIAKLADYKTSYVKKSEHV